jgi:nondiscriminating glutamyl-tRNA synthetase
VGGARTALYNYLFAKKTKGTFVLRVEDTDLARSTDESLKMVMEDLVWLGLNWDEGPDPVTLKDRGNFGPYRQSQRLKIYLNYAHELLENGLAYYCFLSDEELEDQRNEKLSKGEAPQIDSPYKNWSMTQALAEIEKGKKAVVRFKTDHLKKNYIFEDLVRGEITFPSDMVGDFVLLRSDGMPVYNFCNVIDDHLMQISHVLRAEEHLPNTLRQLMLYEAFNWEPPQFGHLSLILDEDRKKLSKRKGATSCHEFKLEGYLPEALNNFIALLGWSHPEGKEIIPFQELKESFDITRLNPAGAVFDPVKLKWMNSQYLKNLTSEQILLALDPFIKDESLQINQNRDISIKAIEVLRSSFETLQDAILSLKVLDDHFFSVTEESQEVLAWDTTKDLLRGWKASVEAMPNDYMTEAEFLSLQDKLKEQFKVKGKYLFMPLRVAVLGRPHGPELKLIVPLLSKYQLLYRVNQL